MKTNNKENHHSPTIYTEENMELLKSVLVLDDKQLYIYTMLSSNGNVKIGRTTDIAQRLKSLSGSNGAGSKIIALYCSPSSYLTTLESICHNHYSYARIPGTEWFDGTKVKFEEVVNYIDGLFYTEDYKKCNELRKKILEKQK